MEGFVTTAQLSKIIGVKLNRIAHAHKTGRLPEPAKVGHHRIYTPSEVEAARQHFAKIDAARAVLKGEDKPKEEEVCL